MSSPSPTQPGIPQGGLVLTSQPSIARVKIPGQAKETYTTVIAAGPCAMCKEGLIVYDYTVGGLILAACCFPIGIACCLAMSTKRCNNCTSIGS